MPDENTRNTRDELLVFGNLGVEVMRSHEWISRPTGRGRGGVEKCGRDAAGQTATHTSKDASTPNARTPAPYARCSAE